MMLFAKIHRYYRSLIPKWRRFLFVALQYHRRYIRRGTVIAITGSCGKTTAKELVYHVLSSRWRGTKAKGTLNGFYSNVITLLRAVPGWHRFSVVEVGTDRPGKLDFMCRGLRPEIGVVLTIGLDHYRAFRSREAVAEEKSNVIKHLPASGLAVLNADDSLVLAMAGLTRAKVVTVGMADNADIRAEKVSSSWPDRLSFDVIIDGECHHVQTRLCGVMWLPSILPAFAMGRHLGLPVTDIIRAIETFDGHFMRMSAHPMPDGSTFILDDWKTPFWSLERTIEFLSQARAPRKILVLGTVSDTPGAQSKRYYQFVRDVLPSVDFVIVTGSLSDSFKALHNKFPPEKVRVIVDMKEVAACLDEQIVPGSLIMLKGTNKQDHLSRVMYNRIKPVTCWVRDCRLRLACCNCSKLYR